MTSSETIGRVRERAPERNEHLTLVFSPLSVPLRSRWRNNGLSADFLGDYVITFLPTEDDLAAQEAKQNEIRHAVAYIANELLENAMKYHQHNGSIPITIYMELTSDGITVSANNGISGEQAQHYKEFIGCLLQEDAGELLIRQLEESAKDEESTSSCLGLLTMITDYGAELSWQFETQPAPSESMTVTTSAVLPLKSASGVSQ